MISVVRRSCFGLPFIYRSEIKKETEELPPFSREELQDSQHDNQTIEYLNQKSEFIEKDQCEGNESDDISSKEEVVLASPSFTDQKIKEAEELPPFSRKNYRIVSTIIKRLNI